MIFANCDEVFPISFVIERKSAPAGSLDGVKHLFVVHERRQSRLSAFAVSLSGRERLGQPYRKGSVSGRTRSAE
jgi:hypothetical protein